MKMPRFYSAQSRFLGGLTLAAIVVGTLFAVGFYLQIRQVLENEVRERAELILFQAESVQRYVRRVLRPRMYKEVPDKFIIEAMSTSFVSRSVMEGAKAHTENLLYRRVAVNARNPLFEATEQERELIGFFAANPNVGHYEGRRLLSGTEYFVTARPVRFEAGCMHCHGDPSEAPAEVIERYGQRGFGHQLGSIEGMDFVGLPMTTAVAKIQRRVVAYLLIFTCAALLFFAASHLVFKRVVVGNLRGMAQVLRATADDDTGEALARQVQSRDEIAEMVEGVEKLSEHLAETRRQLREYAATLPYVAFVDDNLFTCSQDTQNKIKTAIEENNLNRVVVASCSPRTHEPLFQETIREAGLNKYLFEMANIRDQDSWVHQGQPDQATAKAKDLVRMAVAKAALVEPLHQVDLSLTKAAVVVGGGVAGMNAALDLANSGYPVHLVEKTDTLGGNAHFLLNTWKGEAIAPYLEDQIGRAHV